MTDLTIRSVILILTRYICQHPKPIVETADTLFYTQGFEATSFADIAAKVQISRGNFYYHFKTKDEILEALIAQRYARTNTMLRNWERETTDPADRIKSFVRILIMNRDKIMAYGCPVGTLCTELAKLEHTAKASADRLMNLFCQWLETQLALLSPDTDHSALALHLFARTQGIATVAAAIGDAAFVEREVEVMCDFVDALPRRP